MTLTKSSHTQAVNPKVSFRELALISALLLCSTVAIFYDVAFQNRTLLTSPFLWGVMGARPPYGYPELPPAYNVYLLDPLASAVSSEPNAQYLHHVLSSTTLPLWNPHIALGRPLLAAGSPEILSPLRLPVGLWPSPLVWDMLLLSRLLFAGVATYLAARLLDLKPIGAFASALLYSFSGYFLLYINMPHADYALMFPLLTLAIELLRLRVTIPRLLFLGFVLFVSALVDNPQTAVVLFGYCSIYYLVRVAPHPPTLRGWPDFFKRLSPLAVASACALLLALPILLPFVELTGFFGFDSLSVHRHAPSDNLGTLADPPRYLLNWVLPFFNGPPVDAFVSGGWTGLRAYFGVVGGFLLCLGSITAFLHRRPAFIFFLGMLSLSLAKIHGLPALNAVGHLPILNVIAFGLYLPPLATFAATMLGGYGVHSIADRLLSPRLALGSALLFLFLLATLFAMNRSVLAALPSGHLIPQLRFALLLGIGLGALLLSALVIGPRPVVPLLLVLLFSELWLLTLPTRPDPPLALIRAAAGQSQLPVVRRPRRYDPFTKPPFIDYLRAQAGNYRVFGLDRVLYPNSAAAYALDDIRGFTATTVERYYRYVRHFLNPSVRSRFTGAYLPPPRSESEPTRYVDNPFFDLLSVRFLLAHQLPPQIHRTDLIERIVEQNPDIKHLSLTTVEVHGEESFALFQHPRSEARLTLTIPESEPYLTFTPTLDPSVWDPQKGDGVVFEITITSPNDSERQVVYSRWIDPKNTAAHRSLIRQTVNLSSYAGQEIEMTFSTRPGRSSLWDWALWTDLRLRSHDHNPYLKGDQYQLVYRQEVRIYENRHAFPRAFVIRDVRFASSPDEAIDIMESEDFHPGQQAVVEANPSLVTGWPKPHTLPSSSTTSTASVEYSRISNNHARVEVNLSKPGLLIVAETYYPGWRAYVDGRRQELYPTDLVLQGVFLDAGEHRVDLVFAPTAGRLSVVIATLAVPILLGYSFRLRRHASSRPGEAMTHRRRGASSPTER